MMVEEEVEEVRRERVRQLLARQRGKAGAGTGMLLPGACMLLQVLLVAARWVHNL